MLDRLKKLFAPDQPSAAANVDDVAFAVAALLVEAGRADETYTDEERRMIEKALVATFGVGPEEAPAVRQQAETAQQGATDIQRFTRIAKTLPAAQKTKLLESLWRVILSDDARDSWEDTLMRRICGLLYVSDVESGLARQRVEREA